MSTLHVLFHHNDELLKQCLSSLGPHDTLLLAGQAVLYHNDASLSSLCPGELLALSDDANCYGVESPVCKLVTLNEFVSLTKHHERQVKWAL